MLLFNLVIQLLEILETPKAERLDKVVVFNTRKEMEKY